MKISERVRNYPNGFRERQAARDRLPVWARTSQLLVLLACWLVLGLAWFALFNAIYHFLHPQWPASGMISSSAGIIAFSALFGTLTLALIAANFVLWVVPPLRRANEIAARDVSGMTFKTATEDLVTIASFLTPVCILVGIVGAWGPWA